MYEVIHGWSTTWERANCVLLYCTHKTPYCANLFKLAHTPAGSATQKTDLSLYTPSYS